LFDLIGRQALGDDFAEKRVGEGPGIVEADLLEAQFRLAEHDDAQDIASGQAVIGVGVRRLHRGHCPEQQQQ